MSPTSLLKSCVTRVLKCFPVQAQTSLRIGTVSSEPTRYVNTKYGINYRLYRNEKSSYTSLLHMRMHGMFV